MKIPAAIFLALAATGTVSLADGSSSPQTDIAFEIAITVDDLPAHALLPPGMTRSSIARDTLRALKDHHVPRVFGFVNGAAMQDTPDGAEVLDQWRQAGYPLGNHSFSHMNIARAASFADWQEDVRRNDAFLAPWMKTDPARFFRFPNLTAGQTPEQQQQALNFLTAQGYRIADVSVAFSDWDYTSSYARCLARGDRASIDKLKTAYRAGVDAGIVRMKAVSQRVYGRVIPQILLTHIGGFSAIMLPETLHRLDKAGARYISLEQALADPAYASPGGGSVMERTARTRGIKLSDIPAPPDAADMKKLCL